MTTPAPSHPVPASPAGRHLSRLARCAFSGALIAVVLAGAVVRWLAAQDDLWFDEIWSIALGARVTTPAGVFWQIHHDNNHYLNTLLLNAVGPGRASIAYRWPAVALGSALIALLAAAPPLRSRTARVVALVLGASSFELVQYSSEARGYAPALFFGFLAYLAVHRYLANRRAIWMWAFVAASALCVVSHLSGVLVVGASLAWAAWALWPERATLSLRSAGPLFFGPLLVATVLFAVDIRFMRRGGGPPWTAPSLLGKTARLAFNVPAGIGWWAIVAPAAVLLAAVLRMWWRREARAIFFTAMVVAPFATTLARPEVLSSRYFVVALPFVLVLLAETAAEFARRSRIAAAGVAILLAAYVAGGSSRTLELLHDGRGHYSEAIRFIDESSRAAVVRIASDHDLRNGLLVRYYASALHITHRFKYVNADGPAGPSPEWYIVHDDLKGQALEIRPALRSRTGTVYRLVRAYGFAGLSGWRWYLYHAT